MNYKKNVMMGILCAVGMLSTPKTKADTVYVVEEPIYTTTYTVPAVQPVYTTTYTTPVVQPVYTTTVDYNAAYYDGYYDAMNKRWWYNNCWTNRRPPICHTPRYGYGYRGGCRMPAPRYNHCAPAYRPHINRCAPAPRMNHCAPVVHRSFNRCAPAPRFNQCTPRGGFSGGMRHGGRQHGRGCR